MFWFDKDMERVMLAKKKEVLQEIETAKKRVLEELYCLKRSAHSDLCSLQADYNRMALTLTNTVNEIRAELKCITDEYKSMIATTFNQYTTTIENKLLALETFENEVIKEVNDKLSELDTMKAQVEALIAEMEQIVTDGVTEADLQALKEELMTAMENAGKQADWNESDETSAAFIKNKTHWAEFEETVVLNNVPMDSLGYGGTISFDDYTTRVFKLPDNIINSSMGEIIVEFNCTNSRYNGINGEYRLKCAVKDVWAFINFKYDVSFTFVKLIEKAYTYGDTGNHTTEFGSNAGNSPVFIYGDPTTGEFFLTYDPKVSDLRNGYTYTTLTLKTRNPKNTKLLNHEYLGVGNVPGSVLTFTGNEQRWEMPLVYKYSGIGYTPVIEERMNFDGIDNNIGKSLYSANIGDVINTEETFLIEFEPDKYATEAKNLVGMYQFNEDGTSTMLCGCTDKVTFNDGVITAALGNSLNDTLKAGGMTYITLKIYRYSQYEKQGVMPPVVIGENPVDYRFPMVKGGKMVWSAPCVVSPNGTVYTLTVSDDGTLSATPVTE